jgi:uncharacterized membrane protein
MPLHPLVVHFPIVLTFLLPIFVLAALWAIRKGTTPHRAWALPVAMAAALSLSTFVAVQTGEKEEDRVERVVGENVLHGHEEAAERFLVLSGALLLVAAAGFLPKAFGQAARLLTVAGAVGLMAAGAQVGHTGGTLVYRHGAASAYASPAGGARGEAVAAAGERAERAGREDHDR